MIMASKSDLAGVLVNNEDNCCLGEWICAGLISLFYIISIAAEIKLNALFLPVLLCQPIFWLCY